MATAGCSAAARARPSHSPVTAGKLRTAAASRRREAPLPLPPLAQPSAAHPLRVLVIGDSLGEDLGIGLAALVGGQADVRLFPEAVGSTGLVDTAYYNWAARLRTEIARYRPDLVLALFGGNDALSFDQAGRYVPFGSGLWRVDYGGRVATILREARGAGARVLWVGLPMMGPSAVLSNRSMLDLNALYAAEAKDYRGVAYLSTWSLFTNAAGQYAAVLKDSSGQLEIVRDADGVHIAPSAGTDLIATAVLAGIDASEGVDVCPHGDAMWSSLLPKACLASSTAVAR